MKKAGLILCGAAAVACATAGNSVYQNPTSITEVGTTYSDTDLRMIADTMVTSLLSTQRLFEKEGTPTVILGRVENKTTQNIDMGAILSKIEVALLRSGQVRFVSRTALGAMAQEQALSAAMGDGTVQSRLLGGQFTLNGEMTEIPQQQGRIRYYRFALWLVDNSTSEKIWADEKEIKKIK